MKDKGTVLIRTVIVILALIFIVYQTYSMIYKPITTTTAVYYDTYEGIEINGYFVREEKLIDYKITGTERYVVDEGEKVAKGGTIAEVYSSSDIAAAYERVNELTEEIEVLESINSVSDPSSVNLDTLNNRIKRSYMNLLSLTDLNKFTSLDSSLNELLMLLSKKQILTGESKGFDSLLATLKTELSSLKSTLQAPTSKVSAPTSGFFIHQADGLENVLTFDCLEEIDESIFKKIANASSVNAFGKIVSSQNFYIITKMENDDYLNFSEGDSLILRTSISDNEELKATVYKINVSEKKNSAIVVLSCQTMNSQFALVRSAPITIVTEEYEGIRVSNNAVRYSDGVPGVYIVQGSIVKFKPIEIVYRTETFTLCKKSDDGNSNTIRLYDEVIEKGKNLYDGKFIG
ncbi:MAG: HlyD family efflux transporter periplasmic adaptor subunit [Acutalibacteraceae bacterium]|nr:HlyD family efflux transporter periplasmic adaptor subunit [Acutalibacteraceae bacterium]